MCAQHSTAAPHPWSKEALLTKAQRYAEEMIEHEHNEWQFALYSSLVLEFLCRAAVALVSPALLADKSNWNNLYFALGHTPKASKFVPKSVVTAEVLDRLEAIYPEFTPEMKAFCVTHIASRNEELHSGALAFEGVGSASWLPMCYRVAEVLLTVIGRDLVYLVGADEAKVAKEMIAALADETGKTANKAVAVAKDAWQNIAPPEQESLVSEATVWASRREGHRVKCPACGSPALVTGSGVKPPTVTFQDGFVIEKQTYLPAKFECVACGLKISGLSHLTAVGLGDAYTATTTYDPAELYVQEPEYEPDYNEFG